VIQQTHSTHQRSRGQLIVTVKARDGQSVLGDLRQEGCMKARFPRPVDWMEIITLNAAGGIAGGDRVSSTLRVQSGARATIAAQAAERFYRALPEDPSSHVRTHITVEPGARAEWLPQETILFDRCAVDRVLEVDVADNAWFLGVETLVFGRTAMGESVATARLADTIRIRQNGRLALHDAIRINGEIAPILARAAIGAGAAAIATLVLVSPNAAAEIDALRKALTPYDAGVSAWSNMLVARIVTPNGATMRTAITAALGTLRGGRALPRVWNC
jgi:urease accessory protein